MTIIFSLNQSFPFHHLYLIITIISRIPCRSRNQGNKNLGAGCLVCASHSPCGYVWGAREAAASRKHMKQLAWRLNGRAPTLCIWANTVDLFKKQTWSISICVCIYTSSSVSIFISVPRQNLANLPYLCYEQGPHWTILEHFGTKYLVEIKPWKESQDMRRETQWHPVICSFLLSLLTSPFSVYKTPRPLPSLPV